MPGVLPGKREWVLGRIFWRVACFLVLLIWAGCLVCDALSGACMACLVVLIVCYLSFIWVLVLQHTVNSTLSPDGTALFATTHFASSTSSPGGAAPRMCRSTPLFLHFVWLGQPCVLVLQHFASSALSLGGTATCVHTAVPHYLFTFFGLNSSVCGYRSIWLVLSSLQMGAHTAQWVHAAVPCHECWINLWVEGTLLSIL